MVCSDDGCGGSLVFLVAAAADDESGNTGSSDSSGRSKCLGPAKSGQPLTHAHMITICISCCICRKRFSLVNQKPVASLSSYLGVEVLGSPHGNFITIFFHSMANLKALN
jgi:hypothetical protein